MDATKKLAELLQRINAKEVSKEEARRVLADIDPVELSLAEQRLLEEGMTPEELRGLCAAHIEALSDELKRIKLRTGPGHPLHTLVSEHDEILGFLTKLEEVAARLVALAAWERENEDFDRLKRLAAELVEAEKHHAREEDALFPELERRGITGPPRVMRLEHTDLRAKKKHLLELAARVERMDYAAFKHDLKGTAEYIIFNLRDHIFKENTILYPAALKAIPEQEVWARIKEESDNIGYCCFTPGYLKGKTSGSAERTGGLKVLHLAELPLLTSPRGPKIRRVLEEPAVAVTNVLLEPGQELPAHQTPVDVFFYVQAGRGQVSIGADSASVSAGDLIFSPKDIPHGLKAAPDDTFSVLVVKTPNPAPQH
ncbi:MAG TPA: DUF438 domain-containing protein [Firmicutes bacterium]|nr:DUF438 domain-containing protein [Bacillota bacterium]